MKTFLLLRNFFTLIPMLLITISINAQDIENGRYSFKNGSRAQIVVITDTEIRTSSKSRGLQIYEITYRSKIEDANQIICDIGNGEKLIISQTTNGKSLFMFKWKEGDNPIDNVKYWQMKKRSSNKLKKSLSQTKTNW